MSNKFSKYICQNCGSETSQYFGRCIICNEWNSIIEEKKGLLSKNFFDNKNSRSKELKEIQIEELTRIKSKNAFLESLNITYKGLIILDGFNIDDVTTTSSASFEAESEGSSACICVLIKLIAMSA